MANKRKNSDTDMEPSGGGIPSSDAAAKAPKLSKGFLYKPPTNEELNQLKDTENLFHSSLFRMQIKELLKEVMMKEKNAKIDKFLHELKDILVNLSSEQEYDLDDSSINDGRIAIPIHHKPPNMKAVKMIRFTAPDEVRVIGSYLTGTVVKPHTHVDMVVQIPEGLVNEGDFYDKLYSWKRAFYLSIIASMLTSDKYKNSIASVKFSYHLGNILRPMLVIKTTASSGKFKIHLHASADPAIFELNKFSVDRVSFEKHRDLKTTTGNKMRTPYYNTTVLVDLLYMNHLELIKDAVDNSHGIRDGIALLKVWLHQRELDIGQGSFSGFVMSMYVCYLLKKRKLNRQMSSYQIMRNTLLQLAEADWINHPISLADGSDQQCPLLNDFTDHFRITFVDNSGYLNICAYMNIGTFHRVKHEAELSVMHLSNQTQNGGFDALFMKPVSFYHKFDNIVKLSHFQKKMYLHKLNVQSKMFDNGSDMELAMTPAIIDLLKKALGDRVKLIQCQLQPIKEWDLYEAMKPIGAKVRKDLTIGLLLDKDHCYSVLDRGPGADTDEAAEFRAFWGEKSDLRRFQDSSICEAVVWPSKTIAERRTVVKRIVEYIIHLHVGLETKKIQFICDQLDDILKPTSDERYSIKYGTGEEQTIDLIKVYDSLCKQLRQLEDLPLTINSIQGTSPVFRFTEVFPPVRMVQESGPHSPMMPTFKVVCTLEGSGKWPDDKEAIRRMKAAFHIKIGQLLDEQCSLKTRINPEYVDVLKDGYVFRIIVGYVMEISVLRTVTTPEGMVKTLDTDESLKLETDIVKLPKLTSALHGLQQKYSSFGAATCFAKRWINAQLLSNKIPDEAIDLLVASLFVDPAPFQVSNSPLAVFLRFLYLLSTHDWNATPLIININSELTKEDYNEIQSTFTKNRAKLPLMFLSTPFDKFTSLWTKDCPSALVLNLLTVIARESLNLLESQLQTTAMISPANLKAIFRPPLEQYNLLIKLQPQSLTRGFQSFEAKNHSQMYRLPKFLNEWTEKFQFPVTDFDPVEYYIRTLEESFGDIALFFYDKYGGDTIAVLWKPNVFEPTPFKIQKANYSRIDLLRSVEKEMSVPNKKAILNDFIILGNGIVKSVKE
ncbi:nucleolar protein 6-like [Tubulanus polymorphus]|uniref:nucleolar protein 6-like n=1 Tax=Tubulanus polymorphus TaxID=672921 RepID=UPI003DA32CAE